MSKTDATHPSNEETPDAGGITDAEKNAMRELARERKAQSRRGARNNREAGEHDLLEKIAEMPDHDRDMATRIHAIVSTVAPHLMPKTWYGMPAWAQDGKVVCFFQSADKFKVRYATLGFNESAQLDDGAMWPTAFALVDLTPEVERRISELVRQAVDE